MSSYGSYAFAEAVELSGIMSIFFTGVVLATYNTYNLSPTSQVRWLLLGGGGEGGGNVVGVGVVVVAVAGRTDILTLCKDY